MKNKVKSTVNDLDIKHGSCFKWKSADDTWKKDRSSWKDSSVNATGCR